MDSDYSRTELPAIYLVLGEGNWNATVAVRKHHNRKLPGRPLSIDRRLREMGTCLRIRLDVGCPRSVRNLRMEEQILEVVELQRAISTRLLGARTCIPQTSVHCPLQEQQLYPCHILSILSVQELSPHDAPTRPAIYQWKAATQATQTLEVHTQMGLPLLQTLSNIGRDDTAGEHSQRMFFPMSRDYV
jgi:hypothetical protein